MSLTVKVIFDKSVDGFNPGDTAMLSTVKAGEVVKSGDAHYETPPIPKGKKEVRKDV